MRPFPCGWPLSRLSRGRHAEVIPSALGAWRIGDYEEGEMLGRDPFEALFGLQRALDEYSESPWLGETSSGGVAYPPLNAFRKGDDFIVIAELPGVLKSDLIIQVR